MSGFGDNGLEIATIEEVKADIEAKQLETIDPALDVSSDQPLGQMNGIVAERHVIGWELAQWVWNSLNPNAAKGVALDNVNGLIGLPRLQARRSTIALDLALDAGTVIPAGSIVAVDGQSSNTWQSVNEYTALSTGVFAVGFESTQEGNVSANPNTITDIQTPVAGWTSATNGSRVPLIGRTREEDEAYRLRRVDALARAGESTVDAIRADLLNVANVVQAVVVENDTDAWVNGMPPHSIESIIYDDDNQASDTEIAQTIWNNKTGGIKNVGLISANAVDKLGGTRLVWFSRGTRVRFMMAMTVQVLTGWVASQELALRQAILAAFRSQRLGEDVLSLKYRSIAIAQKYAYNVIAYDIGKYPYMYGNVDVPVDTREIATLADADLSITIVNIGQMP